MITARCIGGPKDGELITQTEDCYWFGVEEIRYGIPELIGEYERYTEPGRSQKFEWRWIGMQRQKEI